MEGVGVNPEFWRGRRVLITGHTGFKGSWLSLWLQQMGAELTGFALPAPTQPSLFEVAQVEQGMTSVIGDIRQPAALEAAMQQAAPEVVIHMAAQPLVRRSYQDPVETYSTNVMGTVHLLEAVRRSPSVRAVVNITTDKCYENREWVWGYRENEPMGGHDPYSNSKACAELVSSAYRSSFFAAESSPHVQLATARAGNVIGGGDWAQDRLIPDILAGFSAGQAVMIRRPHAIRPWQHVLEPLRGYLMLAERLHAGDASFAEGWNFGPLEEDTQTVGWITEQMAHRWGSGAQWTTDTAQHPHEAHNLRLDISKARSVLGWHPLMRLDTALTLIVDWSRAHQSGQNMRDLTLAQIAHYQQLATHS